MTKKSYESAIAEHYAREEAAAGVTPPTAEGDPADGQEPAQPTSTEEYAAAIARHYEEEQS